MKKFYLIFIILFSISSVIAQHNFDNQGVIYGHDTNKLTIGSSVIQTNGNPDPSTGILEVTSDTGSFFRLGGSTAEIFLFASDMEGGYGGLDLYICKRINDSLWSKPKNLGPEINTPKDETHPYFTAEKELYFSSNGHLGFGGFDIFVTQLQGRGWTSIQNLMKPINSCGDDIGFSVDQQNTQAFFSSNRKGGKGLYDIYYAPLRTH